jgi:hypothetical protein
VEEEWRLARGRKGGRGGKTGTRGTSTTSGALCGGRMGNGEGARETGEEEGKPENASVASWIPCALLVTVRGYLRFSATDDVSQRYCFRGWR